MDNQETLTLESDRLLLKAIAFDYTEVIFQEFTAEITTYMYPRAAEQIDETQRFIRDSMRRWQNGIDLTLVILKKETLEFLGVCALHRIHTDTPEIGIWTKKTAHGHGYGKEAVHRLKAWADENLEYQYLCYPVVKQNIPSRKIPESLGGRVAREFQQMNLSGKLLDEVEYRIYP